MAGSGQQSLWPVPASVAESEAELAGARTQPIFAPPEKAKHLWLCFYFNRLGIEAPFNSRFDSCAQPRAVLEPRKNRLIVLQGNPAAEDLGIHAGQSANAALALAPDLEIVERDVAAESRIMRELANQAMRFTPAVHLDAANGLLLDVYGSLKYFGGLERLQAVLGDEFAARDYSFILAGAPTGLAALWLARSGRDAIVQVAAELPGHLNALPIDCLEWPEEVYRTLTGFGVTTLGECTRLPRDGLARRIGPGRLKQLDQGFGARPEVFTPHRPPRYFDAALDLPLETHAADLLLVALRTLLERLERFLRRHQGAVRVMWVSLCHQGRPASLERIALLRASTDVAYLLELARIRFDRLQLAAPVLSLRLRSALVPLSSLVAADLWGNGAERDAAAVTLVEQLRIRLGTAAVHGIQPVAEHRPEAAWKVVAPGGSPSGGSQVAGRKQVTTGTHGGGHEPLRPRPVWMLAEPRALSTRAGRPVFGGVLHLEDDPERIESGWWDGRDVRRDYYAARNPRGTRLWVFRDYRESRWYLHGFFG